MMVQQNFRVFLLQSDKSRGGHGVFFVFVCFCLSATAMGIV